MYNSNSRRKQELGVGHKGRQGARRVVLIGLGCGRGSHYNNNYNNNSNKIIVITIL